MATAPTHTGEDAGTSDVLALHRTVPDPPFQSWLFKQIRHVRGAVLLAVSLLAAGYNLSIALRVKASTQEQRLELLSALHGTQALIILVIIAFIAFGRQPRIFPGQNPRGSAAVEQFWNWWPILWVSWLLLYCALAVAGLLGRDVSEDSRLAVCFHLINNCGTLVLMRCYHILSQPTLSDRHPTEGDILPKMGDEAPQANPQGIVPEDRSGQVSPDRARFVFWVCLFLVTLGVEATIAWSAHPTPNPTNGLLVDDIISVFGIVYGILAAVATALLVGQLDSPLLGVPPYAIVVLFFFAAIQPTFDIVTAGADRTSPVWLGATAAIFTMALLGKLCLFVVVQWLALSNRLFYFMVQNHTLYNRVAGHRSTYIDARVSDPHVP